jgi:uncharacterized membrane protein
MTIGPVHLVVVGLENDKLKGEIARELYRASESGAIRVLDALAIQKTDEGDVVSLGATDLTPDQREAYGAVIGGLMGFGATGTEEGVEVGAEMGALAFANQNFGLSREDIQRIADDIPPGATAVMVLFEHRWAVPLKEAVENAGGFVLAQGIVRPENLVVFGEKLAAAAAIAEQREAVSEEQLH